jgi:hypothetical protein
MNRMKSRKRRIIVFGLVAMILLALAVIAQAPVAEAEQVAARHRINPGAAAGPPAWINDLAPISRRDWSYARAAHLLERAGFGGAPEEIEKLARMTPQQAVNYLVEYESPSNGENNLPLFEESGIFDAAMLEDVDRRYESFGDGIRAGYQGKAVYGVKANAGGVRRLQPVIDQSYYRLYAPRFEWNRAQIYLANRMLNTRRPLEEKMWLFWHGHFANENRKVNDYRLLLQQYDTLRRLATGNFRDLLIAVSKDPAMLVYLDNRKNVKGHANENYAREILELFALGVGNYTEQDIKEAARAFTGWTNTGLKFMDRADLHDQGEKVFLGEKGNFNGEQIVDVILKQKACAEFITRKLYRFFVREEISPELNAQLAAKLRAGKYEFKPLLKTIFLSKDFYSPASYATQIKSPVQLIVSTYRKLGVKAVPGIPDFTDLCAGLGQEIGDPPNVKGWDGGRAWINPSTMLQRANFARRLLFPSPDADGYAGRIIPERYRNADKEAEERDRMAAMGQNMIASTQPMTAAQKINSAPDYDLKLGVRNGYLKAFERVKEIPRTPANINLTAMAKGAGLKTAEETVDYFLLRLLRQQPAENDRARLIEFLRQQWGGAEINYGSAELEKSLRGLAHLIMSLPEYQLA